MIINLQASNVHLYFKAHQIFPATKLANLCDYTCLNTDDNYDFTATARDNDHNLTKIHHFAA